jgi:hypothetical protein
VLLLLLGPGVLLHALLSPRGRAVELPLLAAAAWVVSFWWLRLLPFGWLWPVVFLGSACFVAGLFLLKEAPDLPSAMVWVAAGALFALLVRSTLVPPGVDGAMHTAIARVLGDAQGHPTSFRPVWPLDFFHSYPVGQPTLTALFQLGGLDWREAGLAGHAAAYALTAVAMAAVVSRWGRGSALGLAVGFGAVLVARAPLHFWTWGGAPNALSLAFGLAGLAAGVDALREGGARSTAACGLYAAASLLCHGTTPVALAYAAVPLIGVAIALRSEVRRRLPLLLAAGLFALLLAAPYLVTLHAVLGPSERAWVRRVESAAATMGTFPQMLHDVPLIAGAVALVAVLFRAPRKALLPLGLAGALALLVLNGRVFALPLSTLLFPERVAVLALLPLALLAYEALLLHPRLGLFCAGALAVHAAFLQARLVSVGQEHALVTSADLRVLAAVPSCTVLTNYGDAGQWIPALSGRPVTRPQVNVLFFDDVNERVHPCAAFRGEKRPYHVDEVPCPGPLCGPLEKSGGAELFRIVDPALSVEVRAAL